jgi:hypothetical protein
MNFMNAATNAARIEYRNLRTSTKSLTAAQFDNLARSFAYQAADGEEIKPSHWLTAARMIASGSRTF